MAIDGDSAANHIGIGAEVVAPKRIGKHDFIMRAVGPIVVAELKESPGFRLKPKQLKIIRRDGSGAEGLRLRVSQAQVQLSQIKCRSIAE